MSNTSSNSGSSGFQTSPRLWIDQPLHAGASIELPERAVRHIAALRLRDGDSVTLFDGTGGEWEAELLRVGRNGASARLSAWRGVERESPVAITLALGISAGDRMDFAIQKATELGVNTLIPLALARSVVRLSAERADRRLAHWRAVAISACEQCGRNRVPAILPVTDLLEWVSQTFEGPRIALLPNASTRLRDLPPANTCTLLAGAEGGMTEQEQADVFHHGFVAMRFGPRILRTETAPLAVIAAIQAAWGDC